MITIFIASVIVFILGWRYINYLRDRHISKVINDPRSLTYDINYNINYREQKKLNQRTKIGELEGFGDKSEFLKSEVISQSKQINQGIVSHSKQLYEKITKKLGGQTYLELSESVDR